MQEVSLERSLRDVEEGFGRALIRVGIVGCLVIRGEQNGDWLASLALASISTEAQVGVVAERLIIVGRVF